MKKEWIIEYISKPLNKSVEVVILLGYKGE